VSVFWLGPVGALRPLPSPSLGAGPEASSTRFGTVHRSLSGRPTVDRLGIKRTWTLTWPYLDPDTHAYLDALHLGLITGPVWLVDPQRVNQLGVQAASAGSANHSTDGFTTTAGNLAWSPAIRTGAPVDGGISWSVPAEGGRLEATGHVPVPDLLPVVFSVFLAGTRPVRLTVTTENPSGIPVSVLDSPPILPGSTGTRTSLVVTPAPGVAACRVAITAPPDTATTTIGTAAWQVQPGTLPSPWRPGGGAAVVIVESLRVAYPVPGSYATTATLLEV
jgi:hypothetical protein